MKLLSRLLPLEAENPWVMQLYVQDDLTLQPLFELLQRSIALHHSLTDPLARKYLDVMQGHFKAMCEDEGILKDPMSGLPFRGKLRRIRLTVYRRYDNPKGLDRQALVDELKTVCQRVESQVRQVGIKIQRVNGAQFYEWLLRWFNPSPKKTQGDVDALVKRTPYPTRKPFGWSPTQHCLQGSIESTEDGWLFDGVKHKVVTFKDLASSLDDYGVLSRELAQGGEEKYALLDAFPPGSIYTLQLTFESKDAVNEHLNGIEGAAIGKSPAIKDIHRNVEQARAEMDNRHLLFRCVEAIYFKADTEESLKTFETDLESLVESVNLELTPTREEAFGADLYLRFLPFNFNHQFDKKELFRSTYKYADDIARLLPVYGRSLGDGLNPLWIYWNRGGEPFIFDHSSRDFKMANNHMAILGTTGSGKSVTLNNLVLTLSAVRNPRIVAMEVGGSFSLSAKFLAQYGRKVTVMRFDRTRPIAINPYAEAYNALALIEAEEAAVAKREALQAYQGGVEEEVLEQHTTKLAQELAGSKDLASDEELASNEDRDLLNEMVLATRVMITQGNANEEAKLDPTDLSLITRALVHAMKACKHAGEPQMLLSHVIESMTCLANEETNVDLQGRLKQYALRLEYYTTGIRGQFINQPSEPLNDFDFLHVDFGFMQSATYKDLMNIVSISLLAKVLALAEGSKATGRPTELIIDEAHVFFKSDMVAAFIILMAKVARKIGLSLKPTSQNLEDFSGIESKKVLSMMETWLCLSLQADEVSLIEQFKPLTDEQRAMILDVRKYQGIYSEGVLLGKRHAGLFRNVPPRLMLSLAMTEQDERTEREQLRQKHNLTELEAVERMAKDLGKKQHEVSDARLFWY